MIGIYKGQGGSGQNLILVCGIYITWCCCHWHQVQTGVVRAQPLSLMLLFASVHIL